MEIKFRGLSYMKNIKKRHLGILAGLLLTSHLKADDFTINWSGKLVKSEYSSTFESESNIDLSGSKISASYKGKTKSAPEFSEEFGDKTRTFWYQDQMHMTVDIQPKNGDESYMGLESKVDPVYTDWHQDTGEYDTLESDSRSFYVNNNEINIGAFIIGLGTNDFLQETPKNLNFLKDIKKINFKDPITVTVGDMFLDQVEYHVEDIKFSITFNSKRPSRTLAAINWTGELEKVEKNHVSPEISGNTLDLNGARIRVSHMSKSNIKPFESESFPKTIPNRTRSFWPNKLKTIIDINTRDNDPSFMNLKTKIDPVVTNWYTGHDQDDSLEGDSRSIFIEKHDIMLEVGTFEVGLGSEDFFNDYENPENLNFLKKLQDLSLEHRPHVVVGKGFGGETYKINNFKINFELRKNIKDNTVLHVPDIEEIDISKKLTPTLPFAGTIKDNDNLDFTDNIQLSPKPISEAVPFVGKVKYTEIEGGHYFIVLDNGKKIDGHFLPENMRIAGMKVFGKYIPSDYVSFIIIGEPVRFEEIDIDQKVTTALY